MQLEASAPDADLAYMIGLEHAKAERFEVAIEWLDRALERDPAYHYAYFQKAKAFSELGEDEGCAEALDTGIAVARRDGNAKAEGELMELKANLLG
ncbi:MAG: hypothetical protein AAGI68_09035 [Planctomycetota bacterium]